MSEQVLTFDNSSNTPETEQICHIFLSNVLDLNEVLWISAMTDCSSDLLYCWSWCGITLDECHYYIYLLLFVAITYGKVSLWLWKSLENWREINSPILWPPILHVQNHQFICARLPSVTCNHRLSIREHYVQIDINDTSAEEYVHSHKINSSSMTKNVKDCLSSVTLYIVTES